MRNINWRKHLRFDLFNLLLVLPTILVLIWGAWFINAQLKDTETRQIDSTVSDTVTKVAAHYEKVTRANSEEVLPEVILQGDTGIEGIGTLPEGTTIYVKSFNRPGDFCLYAINPKGNDTAQGAGIITGNAIQCSSKVDKARQFKPKDVVAKVEEF